MEWLEKKTFAFCLLPFVIVPFGVGVPFVAAIINAVAWLFIIAFIFIRLGRRDTSTNIFAELYKQFEPSNENNGAKEILWQLRTLLFFLIKHMSPLCSAEIALFDKSTGLYRSALLLGVPRAGDATAMVAGAVDWEKTMESVMPSVIFIPIKFSGEVRGTMRFCLAEKSMLPTSLDQQLAMHAAHLASAIFANSLFQDELRELSAQTQQTVRAKTGFLANISHEIRAPLGLISNTLQILSDGVLGAVSAEQKEIIQDSQKSLTHLISLVGDVLEFSKAESGSVQLQPVSVNILDAVETVTGLLEHEVSKKGHALHINVDAKLYAQVDARHLQQILTNLITNAVKYTEAGGTITVSAQSSIDDTIICSVRDTGIGIKKEMLGSIFDPFERGDERYALEQAGYGLGLSLVKKLTTLNSGTIHVWSDPGQGSVFMVTLPAAKAQAALPAPIRATTQFSIADVVIGALQLGQTSSSEHHLLVQALRAKGCTVEELYSLSDISREATLPFYIIDASDDERSLMAALQLLKGQASAESSNIIVLTPRAFNFEAEKMLKSGATLIISKPYEIDSIIKSIEKLAHTK